MNLGAKKVKTVKKAFSVLKVDFSMKLGAKVVQDMISCQKNLLRFKN